MGVVLSTVVSSRIMRLFMCSFTLIAITTIRIIITTHFTTLPVAAPPLTRPPAPSTRMLGEWRFEIALAHLRCHLHRRKVVIDFHRGRTADSRTPVWTSCSRQTWRLVGTLARLPHVVFVCVPCFFRESHLTGDRRGTLTAPCIPIRHRRAGSCAPIDRILTTFELKVFVGNVPARDLMSPCHDDYTAD